MIFLNKNTNLKWNITDKEHIKMLLQDKENYKVLEDIHENKENEVEEINYSEMNYKDLQALCKEKNINSYGKKKDELIELLGGVE